MSAGPSISGVSISCELPCDLQSVAPFCLQAREFLGRAGVSETEMDPWELVLTEAANNAIRHCRPGEDQPPIRVDLLATAEWVEARITDHTPGFEWPEKAELPPDDSESGRGVFLIQNLTDESSYLLGRGSNCLCLRRHRSAPKRVPAPPNPPAEEELREVRHTLDLMTEELASTYESLSAIFRFTTELQESGHSGGFVERWLKQLLVITESDWVVLRLCDSSNRELVVSAASVDDWQGEPLPLKAPAPAHPSVEVRAATQLSDVWFDPGSPLLPGDPLTHVAGKGCGFAHPLLVSDTLIGVLSIGRHDGARLFQSGHVSVSQTLGDFLGLQVRSTQLQKEQVRTRLNARDLEIAGNLQRSLLPDQLPTLSGADLAAFYRSAREIGGDYYDALYVGEGSILLVVADVMGKGLPAALFAFMFRSLLKARRDLAAEPGKLLEWLNRNLFVELDRTDMFITAQLVLLNCQRREMRISSAGHPPMILANSNGTTRGTSRGGPPLGILVGAVFPEEVHSLGDGRALMFSDGLIEARNPAGDLMGLDPVTAAMSEAARLGESSEATRQRLTRLLQEFEHSAEAADDTAFIVIACTRPN